MESHKDLSVLMVSFNVRGCLKNCLISIYQNSGIDNLEIIVVDNASADGTPEMIKESFPQVRLIENTENIFLTKADNQALRQANSEYILLLNTDTLIQNGTLKTMLEFLKNNPDVAAVGPRIVNTNGEFEDCIALGRTWDYFLYNHTLLSKIFRQKAEKINKKSFIAGWDRNSDRDAEIMIDVCLMVKADLLNRVGLYDEKFKLYFAEDDFCNRIRKTGKRIHFLSSLAVTHLKHQSLISVDKRKIARIYQDDACTYVRKYFGFMRGAIFLTFIKLTRILASIRGLIKDKNE